MPEKIHLPHRLGRHIRLLFMISQNLLNGIRELLLLRKLSASLTKGQLPLLPEIEADAHIQPAGLIASEE